MNDPWVLAGRKARDDLDIYLDLGPDDANVAVAIVLAAVHPEYDRVCAERDAALEQRDHLSWLLAEAQDALAGSPTYGYTRYSQLMEKIDEARRLVTGRTEETS